MIIRSRPAGNSGVFVCVFVFVSYPDTIRACVRITLPSTLILFVCLCVCFSVFSLVEYPDTIAIDGLPGCYCQERCDEMDCDGQTIITLTDVNEIPQNGSAPMLTTLSDCGADFREFLSGGAGPLHLHMRLATMATPMTMTDAAATARLSGLPGPAQQWRAARPHARWTHDKHGPLSPLFE